MTLKVLKPGILTTIQDLGRIGSQKYGVIAGGCMDTFAAKAANILVLNDPRAALLEMTVIGATIQFQRDHVIALCGHGFQPLLDGEALPGWRAVFVRAGATLHVGPARAGTRCYLAIAGGVNVPEVMGSRSTYLRAEIGGYKGRALQTGDELEAGPLSTRQKEFFPAPHSSGQSSMPLSAEVSPHIRPPYSQAPTIRFVRGAHYEKFDERSHQQLETARYRVLSQSDRMGYRLEGPKLQLAKPEEMLSEAVTFGTVQVPSDGNPIVLMADRQTTGGYPKIAQVISVDLPLMAQLHPGASVGFREVTLAEAQHLYLDREKQLKQLAAGILAQQVEI